MVLGPQTTVAGIARRKGLLGAPFGAWVFRRRDVYIVAHKDDMTHAALEGCLSDEGVRPLADELCATGRARNVDTASLWRVGGPVSARPIGMVIPCNTTRHVDSFPLTELTQFQRLSCHAGMYASPLKQQRALAVLVENEREDNPKQKQHDAAEYDADGNLEEKGHGERWGAE